MQKNAIAFGTFDGLHKGHMAVLNRILNAGYSPIAITFSLPPNLPEKSGLIISSEEKVALLKNMGILPVVLKFEEVRNITPNNFLNQMVKEFKPGLISTGFNFRFGKGAAGNTKYLAEFCSENNIKYMVTQPVMWEEKIVSSTEIRKLISKGRVETAAKMLGRSFSFSGAIVHGDARGRTLGFPTINIVYPKALVEPRYGVYSSRVSIDGKVYNGITNIGIRPTFKTDYVISETHLLDFKGEIYGKIATIELLDFIRSEVKFNSPEELKKAIQGDIEKADTLRKG